MNAAGGVNDQGNNDADNTGGTGEGNNGNIDPSAVAGSTGVPGSPVGGENGGGGGNNDQGGNNGGDDGGEKICCCKQERSCIPKNCFKRDCLAKLCNPRIKQCIDLNKEDLVKGFENQNGVLGDDKEINSKF